MAEPVTNRYFHNTSVNVPFTDPNQRTFTGDGSSVLHIPNCKSVKSVRVGEILLPETIVHDELVRTMPDEFQTSTYPVYELNADETGNPILQRSLLSNHGLWQDKVTIYVIGEWDDAPAPIKEQKELPLEGDKEPAV